MTVIGEIVVYDHDLIYKIFFLENISLIRFWDGEIGLT